MKSFRYLKHIALALATVTWTGAEAQTLQDAENRLASAQNDYFNSIYTGKLKTAAEREAYRANTVDAASLEVDQLIESRWQEVFQRQLTQPPAPPEMEIPTAKWQEIKTHLDPKSPNQMAGNGRAGSADNANAPARAPAANVEMPPAAGAAEYLDPSIVPKNMDFSRKPAPPAPAAPENKPTDLNLD